MLKIILWKMITVNAKKIIDQILNEEEIAIKPLNFFKSTLFK